MRIFNKFFVTVLVALCVVNAHANEKSLRIDFVAENMGAVVIKNESMDFTNDTSVTRTYDSTYFTKNGLCLYGQSEHNIVIGLVGNLLGDVKLEVKLEPLQEGSIKFEPQLNDEVIRMDYHDNPNITATMVGCKGIKITATRK